MSCVLATIFVAMLQMFAIEKAKITLSRMLCGLVALLVLNSSIDTPAASDVMTLDDGWYVEDMSYNDMESFFELFTEGLLDLEDFVAEHDNDADDTEKQSKVPQFFVDMRPAIPQPPAVICEPSMYPEKVDCLLQQPTRQYTPPPDKIA
jgi:hypothetical protein